MSIRRKKPTMIDVARMAGVSQTTVSFILSGRSDGDDRISDDTRQRVMDAVSRLGYVPNQAARSLRKQRTERVALFIDRMGAPYFESLALSLQARAEASGYSLILLMGKTRAQKQLVLHSLHQGLVDGIFLTSLRDFSSEDLARLARVGIALVVYDNSLSAAGVDFVRYPAFRAAHSAVDYLVGKGHQNIAYISYGHADESPDKRLEGYLAGMQAHSLASASLLLEYEDWLSRERIYHHALDLIRQRSKPSAIICASDLVAITAIAAAQDLGLSVPRDLAIIGFGNIPEGVFVRPALTTLGPDPLDFSPAIEMLFSRLLGKAPAEGRTWEMEWKLIERSST